MQECKKYSHYWKPKQVEGVEWLPKSFYQQCFPLEAQYLILFRDSSKKPTQSKKFCWNNDCVFTHTRRTSMMWCWPVTPSQHIVKYNNINSYSSTVFSSVCVLALTINVIMASPVEEQFSKASSNFAGELYQVSKNRFFWFSNLTAMLTVCLLQR